MVTAAKLGAQAVEQMADLWKVDASRSIRTQDGFDWWPGNFRVSVTAHPRMDGQGPATCALWIRTELLRDVPIESDKFVHGSRSHPDSPHRRTLGYIHLQRLGPSMLRELTAPGYGQRTQRT